LFLTPNNLDRDVGDGPIWNVAGGQRRFSAFRTLRWRLALPYILIVIVVMAILDVSLAIALRNEYRDEMARNLGSEAELVAQLSAAAVLGGGGREAVSPIVQGLAGRVESG
jgi:hypothetical protein